tara:strand:+ start:595 stop:1131 length:537 start_codon:yes stop_codon:yes gene_type:complete
VKPPYRSRGNNDDETRTNEQIKADKVRVVDENGEMVGVISPAQAVEMARNAGLDLVEVSPNANPPVCKILDYGKYKYEQQKRAQEAKKKQTKVELKEIKLRPGIEEHDYQVKLRKIVEFIEKSNKVKVSMRFRGREMAHKEIGLAVMERVLEDTKEIAKADSKPKFDGRQALMMLSPA